MRDDDNDATINEENDGSSRSSIKIVSANEGGSAVPEATEPRASSCDNRHVRYRVKRTSGDARSSLALIMKGGFRWHFLSRPIRVRYDASKGPFNRSEFQQEFPPPRRAFSPNFRILPRMNSIHGPLFALARGRKAGKCLPSSGVPRFLMSR